MFAIAVDIPSKNICKTCVISYATSLLSIRGTQYHTDHINEPLVTTRSTVCQMFWKFSIFLATLTFTCTETVNTRTSGDILEWHLLCYRCVLRVYNIINVSFGSQLNATSLPAPNVALLQPWLDPNTSL